MPSIWSLDPLSHSHSPTPNLKDPFSSSSTSMASHLLKSLQCKSNAYTDIIHNPKPVNPKKPIIPSCSDSSQTLKDVIYFFPKQPQPDPKSKTHKKPVKKPKPVITFPSPKPKPASFPTLTELPSGHSSRSVVEIIFGSSWSETGFKFPGRVEILFRVHNPTRTVARFEEYRSAVRAAGADDVRCAVDGNEMMRFYCAPNLSFCGGDGIFDASVVCLPGGKGIRTFAGSGRAHECVRRDGQSRRSMLVCRVIAGRVRSGSDPEGVGESVSRGNGELVVFDSRAVLPCFLIIYKI